MPSPTAICLSPVAPAPSRRRPICGLPPAAGRAQRAFSLIEIMVAVGLLSVIMLGLLAMFSQTQRAFRLSMTQVDVMQGGRAASDLLSRELAEMTPSNWRDATNFYAQLASVPQLQPLPGNGAAARQNLLEDVFYLTRQNQTCYGIGYHVVPIGVGVGSLYRFLGTATVNQDPAPLLGNFASAARLNPPSNSFGMQVSRIVDGVVHFRVKTFDPNGFWITNTFVTPYLGANVVVLGDKLVQFTSNAVPVTVEMEIGILEDPTLQRYKSIRNPQAQLAYLRAHAGQVHLFRQLIAIRGVDLTAYSTIFYP